MNLVILKCENLVFTLHGGFKTNKIGDKDIRTCVAISVKNIKLSVARLIKHHVKLIGEIETTPVHKFQAFQDPAGNILEYAQYFNKNRG